MSSKDRKAALRVLLGVLLAVAILLGPGIPAGIVSGLVGCGALIVLMQKPGATTGERTESGRFTATHRWECRKSVDLDQLVASVTDRARLRLQETDTREGTRVVTMKGGSHARTRLLGGYFINPVYLPVRAELDLSLRKYGHSGALRLRVTDAFWPGLRDGRLRERFDMRVAQIETAVDGALSNAGVRPSK